MKKESALSQLASRLRRLNEWRRGAEVEQPDPYIIGRDIDKAIWCIERLEKLQKEAKK